jgi:hypothetical protein
MYAVGVTGNPGDRLITHFFDKLPDDEKLKSIIAEIVSNKVEVKVGFHVGEPQIFTPQTPKPQN